MRASFSADGQGQALLDLRREGALHQPDLSDLPALTEEERAMAARTWRGRMVNEHVSAQVFAGLVPQLMGAAFPPVAIAALPGMIADELRHAELCAGVVLALGHAPVAPLPALARMPDHPEVGPLEAALRNLLSVCCLSETVAVAVIRAEQAELEGTALGGVLSRILADEVQHARFGWTLLGTLAPLLDEAARARTRRYLVTALQHLEDYELPRLPVHLGLRPELALAGVCDGGLARQIFQDTLSLVVLPELERVGLRPAA